MDIQVSIQSSGQLEELRNLEDWLLEEPGLAECPVTRPSAAPRPGEMGALSDVLVVALGSGGMGVALASSLSVWLRTRVSDLTLRIRTQSGEVELTARNTKDAEALIQAIISSPSASDSEPA
jgi:Effector Associated Constant Component 1